MPRTALEVFSARLRAKRESAGMSQRALGIEAGIDESVSSVRVNRYERGVHSPHLETAQKLAAVLKVPLPYLVADDDQLARVIELFSALSRENQDRYLRLLEDD